MFNLIGAAEHPVLLPITGAPVPGASAGTIAFPVVENQPIEIPLRLTNIGETSASVLPLFFAVVSSRACEDRFQMDSVYRGADLHAMPRVCRI